MGLGLGLGLGLGVGSGLGLGLGLGLGSGLGLGLGLAPLGLGLAPLAHALEPVSTSRGTPSFPGCGLYTVHSPGVCHRIKAGRVHKLPCVHRRNTRGREAALRWYTQGNRAARVHARQQGCGGTRL